MNNDAGVPGATPRARLPWLAERLQPRPTNRTAGSEDHTSQDGQKKHARRIAFLDDLIRQIDLVIYSQIVMICYLDCSIGKLLLRLLPQALYASDPQLAYYIAKFTTRPYVICIVVINIICAFLHLVWNPPSGTELSRGYIHGGYLIDFVGELGPASKWKMLSLDLCIFSLQLLQLATILEQHKVKLSLGDSVLLGVNERLVQQSGGQDLDAEEQGIRRSQEFVQDVETGREDNVQDPLVSGSRQIDESYDGRMLILTFNPVHLISKAWQRHSDVPLPQIPIPQ